MHELGQLQALLVPEEQEKARRFHFEKDRNHYTAARGFLRTILGRYLNLDPAKLRFSYNAFGKPGLASSINQIELCFNLAHSHGLALFAFNRGREIGIDLEYARSNIELEKLAERFFAPAEVASLRSLPGELRRKAFFNCWARKEAFIKARGLGLSLPLKQFVVTLAPGEEVELLAAEGDPQAPARWILRELDAAEGFAAAMAVEGKGWELRCFEIKT